MPYMIENITGSPLTIDSVAIAAWARQSRPAITAAITTAIAAKQVTAVEYEELGKEIAAKRTMEEVTPLTGTTVTVSDDTETYLVTPAGTIAALTINMPATPYDGQRVHMVFDQAVTAVTHQATGKTLKGALTAASAKSFAVYEYRASNTTWYRVG